MKCRLSGVVVTILCTALASPLLSQAASVSPALSSRDFGSLALNASSSAATLTYSVTGGATIPNFTLRYGTDFTIGQPTCSNSSPSTCNLSVIFTPKTYAGIKQDAVLISDSTTGALLSTTFLHGIGLAPQPVLGPGVMTAYAGNGALGYTGDGGFAINAELSNPQAVAVDGAGNVYIADSLAPAIRKVTATSGIITTLAGPGGLNTPTGLAVDGARNVYIADSGSNRILKLNAISNLTTVVAGTGAVSTNLGDGNLATQSSLHNPTGIAVDPAGNLYIADQYNNRIRRVDALTGIITTVAGGGSGNSGGDAQGDGGLAVNALLNGPAAVALDSSGNLYIADSGNDLIREVQAQTGIISVIAGNGSPSYSGDGSAALQAGLNQPNGLQVDAAGDVYIVDSHNNAIRQVNGAGVISTIDDGFNNPGGMAIDPAGNVYIADQGNSKVWKLSPGPNTLAFGLVAVGQVSTAQTVSVANIGNQALTISSGFSLSGWFEQQSSGAVDCSANLTVAAAASCSIAVAFVPQAAASPFPTTLPITNTLFISLSGTGTGTGSLSTDPSVSPATVSFGSQAGGITSQTQTVTLTNNTSNALTVRVTLSSQVFSVTETNCQSSLAAHASCAVTVAFQPQTAGPSSATLLLTESNANTQFSQSVYLTGTGTVVSPVLSTSTLSFSNSGLPMTQTITLTNPNAVALAIDSMALSRADVFSMATTCPTSLAANSSCTASVTFTPTTSIISPSTLTFSFSSFNSQTVTLTTANPVLAFTGSTTSLGPQPRNLRSFPVSYVLQNLSNNPVTVNSIAIAGLNATDFAQVNNCGVSIPAGQGCMIWLSYAPSYTSSASATANIVVADSAPGSPHSLAVSGSATGLSQAVICVDSPQAGKTVSGVIPLSGWAVSDTAAITGITLMVDGKALGSATYGINRPDVCAAYPGRSGCPNVGWGPAMLDTTTLADGSHTLAVTASSASGNTTISVPFTVANLNSAISHTSSICIDYPNAVSISSGYATFQGWAIDNNAAISSVSLAIDGVPVTVANYGMARPDVCVVYPGRAGCPNVGWSVALDTRQFSNGLHLLAVTTQTANGKFTTISTPFQIANPIPSTITAHIDYPSSGPVSGMLLASGWAIDTSTTIAGVSLSIDGVPQGAAASNSRPDVCKAYGSPKACPNVGWNESIDTTKFADGTHTLEILIANSNSKELILEKPFTISNVKNSSIDTTLVNIDLPGPASGLLSGVVELSGWAIDQVTPIANVAISIDGVLSSLVQPSLFRPDVCAVYPGSAGCPLVGWGTLLNTSSLADGQHVLQATATSQQGMRSTKTITFATSNGAQDTSQGQIVWMDSPLASATVSGTINMSGWAVNRISTIQKVVITVDGVAAGTAQFGNPRPDVCLSYQSAGCPYVGWSYALSTTQLSDGIHTLRAIEYASNGSSSASRSVVVLNAPGSMKICIDNPVSTGNYSGTIEVSGWAVNGGNAVTSVAVSVDGQPLGPAKYGRSRPDVCAVFSGQAGCPNVGWTFSLDTTAFLNGAHTLQISGLSAGGIRFTQPVAFSIAN